MKTLRRIASVSVLLAMTAYALFFVGTVAAVVTATGCSTTATSGDPFVVEAEKDLRTAFNVVDSFLEWEANNRATAGSDVTAAADTIRTTFPAAYKSAWDTLTTYKQNRDPAGRANLATWLQTINAAMLNAVRAMPQAQASSAISKSTAR